MNKEDYNKYYIQGSDHYLIPKDVFKELFNEMSNWKEDTKKYKEVIDKAIEYIIDELLDGNIERHRKYYMDISGSDLPSDCIVKIVDILEDKDE